MIPNGGISKGQIWRHRETKTDVHIVDLYENDVVFRILTLDHNGYYTREPDGLSIREDDFHKFYCYLGNNEAIV